jgi:protein-arginine kinase activator protein McsA
MECAGKARTVKADSRRAAVTKNCSQCGKSYSPHYGQLVAFAQSQFCSHECANEGKKRTIDDLYLKIRVDPRRGCHLWTGQHNRGGYGVTRFNGEKWLVHKLIWEHFNGPVPEGLQLDHLCRNTTCCNREHLRVTTPRENTLASDNICARNARRMNCPKCGGQYSELVPGGRRYCKECMRKYTAAYAREKRQNDPAFAERAAAAERRYREKLKDNPESIRVRNRNVSCPKCGGPYSTFPNGMRYCKPCRTEWQRNRDNKASQPESIAGG